jgi:secretion/DNA translocation related CpaE-like protein
MEQLPGFPASHGAPPLVSGSRRPLLVTADPELLDDVLRLASAAGIEIDVAPGAAAARSSWPAAALVLVGSDLAATIARAAIRRRSGVVLVSRDQDDAGVWEQAVGIGAEHVAVLPDAEAWLVERLGDSAEPAGHALTVGVVGGRGGAGASTLAAALALSGVRRPAGRRTLVDADPLGGGIDLVFGGEQVDGVRWRELATASGRIGGAALRDALPRVGELAVLSFDRGDPFELRTEAMSSVLAAARRGCDLVVIDLPRHFDAVTHQVLSEIDIALIVVPAELRACAAAAPVAARLGEHCSDIRVVARGPAPGGLGQDDIATALGLPVSVFLAPEPDLARALERGEPPGSVGRGPLARYCTAFLTAELAGSRGSTEIHDRVPTGGPSPDAQTVALGWLPR